MFVWYIRAKSRTAGALSSSSTVQGIRQTQLGRSVTVPGTFCWSSTLKRSSCASTKKRLGVLQSSATTALCNSPSGSAGSPGEPRRSGPSNPRETSSSSSRRRSWRRFSSARLNDGSSGNRPIARRVSRSCPVQNPANVARSWVVMETIASRGYSSGRPAGAVVVALEPQQAA